MNKGLTMPEKTAMFSEKQVVALTGFSRKQLYNISISGIVEPLRDPILYTWNQVLFLRVLYLLREDWSMQRLEKIFNECPDYGIEKIIKLIPDSIAVMLFAKSDDVTELEMMVTLDFEDKRFDDNFKKTIDNIKEGKPLNYEETHTIIACIMGNKQTITGAKISIKKQTLIIIPKVIRDLTMAAEGLNIEILDLKVG
jgi:hypothetical protein